MSRLPVSARAIGRLLKDIEAAGGEHVLAVGGASELAPELRQQFLRGRAEPAAVRLGPPEGADAYVYVLAGEPGDADLDLLRRARRARVPVIALVRGIPESFAAIPYVLATDVVWVASGDAFPLETIAQVLAARLGEHGAPLAARVPLLRGPVCEWVLESFARKNGLAAGIGRVGLPALALNEVRLVIRLAQAHGAVNVSEQVPELAATLGTGFGLRALAQELQALLPGVAWAVRCGVAYGGTRALGEVARLRFASAATPPRASASPAAP